MRMSSGFIIHQHPVPLEENMSNLTSASGEATSVSSSQQQSSSFASPSANPNPVKKKRSLPGNPDPESEVVALSPKSLLATNRFLCEICNKGFQRDQNLQLHRRGHNLPWKLKQRTSKEVRKKVYICPEVTCVHHDPSRALGDLTGIKKHFCRKHGDKKWKCDKCSKKYAVQSDWKAHSKTCGTREYRCDCGTLFSRRDSFITHRAFCDALAEESARFISANPVPIDHNPFLFSQATTSHDHHSSTTSLPNFTTDNHGFQGQQLMEKEHQQHQDFTTRPDLQQWLACQASSSSPAHLINSMGHTRLPSSLLPTGLGHEMTTLSNASSLPPPSHQASAPPHMSATALLQRAAQMGAATVCRPSQMAAPHSSAQEVGRLGRASAPHIVHDMTMTSLPSAASGFDGSFEDIFGEMLETKMEANNGVKIGKADGMTRDFLGLTAFSHGDILNITGLDPSMSSSCKQSKEPWHGHR